jgi:hypothetical protein
MRMDPNVEEVDVAALAAVLRQAFDASPPAGFWTIAGPTS